MPACRSTSCSGGVHRAGTMMSVCSLLQFSPARAERQAHAVVAEREGLGQREIHLRRPLATALR